MRVTDKTPEDLEFLAIWKPESMVIHVISIPDNEGWSPGEPCVTLCGRKIVNAFVSADVVEGDRPCKSCDKKTSVAIVMFETAEVMGDIIRAYRDHQIQLGMMFWINQGIENGYITPPFCYFHVGAVPLSEAEVELVEGGEEVCVMIMRLDPFNSLDSFNDLPQ